MALKASGWFMAKSASTFRLSSILLAFTFPMNWLYDIPWRRAPALIRAIQSERKFLFFDPTISIGIAHRFIYRVFSNGPHIFASSEISFGLFKNFFTSGSRGDGVYWSWHNLNFFDGGGIATLIGSHPSGFNKFITIAFYFKRNCSLMLFTSLSWTNPECVNFNLRFFDFLVRMWLLNACFLLILPEPVSLNRFFALDLVFILGMMLFLYYYSLYFIFWA